MLDLYFFTRNREFKENRDPEKEILSTCREFKVGFVAYSPLGRNFLTGRLKKPEDLSPEDWRHHHPRFEGDNFQRNLVLFEAVQQMANKKACTPAQMALCWVLTKGEDIVPKPGTKQLRYLEENLKALQLHFTPEEMRQLEQAFPLGAATGERYNPQGMKALNH